MKSILIHNPRCSKSREAKEILEAKGISFTVLDYLQDGLSEALLSELPEILQMDYSAFVRTKDELYFELNLANKKLSKSEWIKVLIEHPKLLERPIFLHQGKGVIGRPPERVLEILEG